MYRIIQTRKIWFVASGILVLGSILGLVLFGLQLGIDFTGGSLMSLEFKNQRPASLEVEEILKDIVSVTAQPVESKEMVLRFKDVPDATRQEILQKLDEKFGEVEELSFESIGPTIGKELRQKSLIAVILTVAAIILYISFAFRKVSQGPVSSWVYGAAAAVALGHDILIVIGLFVLLGKFLQVEINSLFVTALLTILGFSVHDTIVVFDRIRERIRLNPSADFEMIINESINQTIVRSLNTSLTTLFVLTSLFLFGGESIKFFVLALIVGIVVGTYSSIFVASPLLLVWNNLKTKT